MPSANNTASKYVSIVLVFKSTAKIKIKIKQFLLDTIFVYSKQNDTVDSVLRQKESLTAAAAAQEHI